MSVDCTPYRPDCDGDGDYWLGRPNALVPVRGGYGGISRAWEDTTSIVTTAAGVPRAQVSPSRPYRVWDLDLDPVLDGEASLLHQMVATDPGPYTLVEPWAQVTNVLTPEGSTLTRELGYARGGRWMTDRGGYVPSVLLNPGASASNEAQVWSGAGPICPDLRPCTASMELATPLGVGASVQIVFVNSSNSPVSWTNGNPVTGMDRLRRSTVTAIPPATAVAAWVVATRARVVAQAALTWTPHANDWHVGGLAQQCVITKVGDEITRAGAGRHFTQREYSTSFTITELGGA